MKSLTPQQLRSFGFHDSPIERLVLNPGTAELMIQFEVYYAIENPEKPKALVFQRIGDLWCDGQYDLDMLPEDCCIYDLHVNEGDQSSLIVDITIKAYDRAGKGWASSFVQLHFVAESVAGAWL